MQASLLKQFGRQANRRSLRFSRSGVFVALTAFSLLAHGVVLGLPWPEAEVSQAESTPSAEPGAEAMDVAILPSSALKPPRADTPERAADKPRDRRPQSAQAAPPRTVERAPQPPPPPVDEPPTPPPDMPKTEPAAADPQLPPLPDEADDADPITDLPDEPGSGTLGSPDPAPPRSLAERLQDVTAYTHDGSKNLGNGAITVAQGWAAEGQTYPDKAEPMELPYELGTACLDNPPLRGTLMVVLDASGAFIRGPEVISSTGYDILDEQAVERVRSLTYTLPDRDETKAYSVDIVVLYPDSCP